MLYKSDRFSQNGIRKITDCFVIGWFSIFKRASKMDTLFYNFSSIRTAENMNSVHGPYTVKANHAHFPLHSGNFDVEDNFTEWKANGPKRR